MKIFKQIDRFVGKSKIKMQKNAPVIFTGLTIAGVVVTAALSARAGWKAKEKLDHIEKVRDDKPTKFQYARVGVTCAIPPAIAMGTTIALAITNHRINQETQQNLIAGYILLDKTFREYRQRIRNEFGFEKEKEIYDICSGKAEPVEQEEKPLFYDTYGKRFFNLSWEEIMDAEYQINRSFILRGHVSLNDFYSFLGLDWIVEGEDKGWSEYIGETTYGYRWIDFEHRFTTTDDGLECYILDYPFPPHEDYLD